jgi:hypothetical protein
MKRSAVAVLLATRALLNPLAEDQGPANPTSGIQAPLFQPPAVTLSIGEIARRAQSRSLEILKAVQRAERAREDLVGEPELMDSSLSVGGGYTSGAQAAGGWYGQSSLSLPIFPQLSVGGAVSVDRQSRIEEELSLVVQPFAPPRQTYSEEESYESARVAERYLRRSIYLDAEQAALNLLIRNSELDLSRSTVELEQRKYELVQRRQEIGEASFQDVQDGLVDLIEARQSLFNSEQRYLGDWRILQLFFASREERIGVAPLSLDGLLELVSGRREEVAGFEDAGPASQKLETLRIELAALRSELEATPTWRPDLALAAGVVFPEVSPSASLALSFSPNQLKGEEREELQEDIEVKHMEIATESYAAELQKMLGKQGIAIAEEALRSAQIQRERDRVALEEGELLFQQGRRTSLELEQLRLNLRRTEIRGFEAAAELYGALGNYLMLFVSEESG